MGMEPHKCILHPLTGKEVEILRANDITYWNEHFNKSTSQLNHLTALYASQKEDLNFIKFYLYLVCKVYAKICKSQVWFHSHKSLQVVLFHYSNYVGKYLTERRKRFHGFKVFIFLISIKSCTPVRSFVRPYERQAPENFKS